MQADQQQQQQTLSRGKAAWQGALLAFKATKDKKRRADAWEELALSVLHLVCGTDWDDLREDAKANREKIFWEAVVSPKSRLTEKEVADL